MNGGCVPPEQPALPPESTEESGKWEDELHKDTNVVLLPDRDFLCFHKEWVSPTSPSHLGTFSR